MQKKKKKNWLLYIFSFLLHELKEDKSFLVEK